jgi:hypothetical protein
MSDPLPKELLAQRHDADFEEGQDPVRVALTLEWAEPLLVRTQAAMALGADVDTDDQFNDLVSELWDGLRDRLTRQDLLYIALLFLNHKTEPQVKELLYEMRRDMSCLDRSLGALGA